MWCDCGWCSVAKSCPALCELMNCSMPGFSILHYLLEFFQTHVYWVSDATQTSHPLWSPSLSFNLSQHQDLFQRVGFSHQVDKVLKLQHQSFQWIFRLIAFRIDCFDLLTVQGSLESPPTPQFKSINSSVLSLLYAPTLTSIHDHCKYHSFDYTDLCRQSDMSAFSIRCLGSFSSKEQVSFNFMAAVTVHSDFKVQENEICHCFHFLPIYLPRSDGTRCHDLSFWMLTFKPAFSLYSFTFIKMLFISSSLSAIRVVSSTNLRLLIFLPAVLIPACATSSPAFRMMYSF